MCGEVRCLVVMVWFDMRGVEGGDGSILEKYGMLLEQSVMVMVYFV